MSTPKFQSFSMQDADGYGWSFYRVHDEKGNAMIEVRGPTGTIMIPINVLLFIRDVFGKAER